MRSIVKGVPRRLATYTLVTLFALFLWTTSHASAAPDTPSFTAPTETDQPGTFTLEWTDESASGATSYDLKKGDSDGHDVTRYTSSIGHAINVYADPGTTALNKKFGTAALTFDGTSDYLTLADSSDWDIAANTTDDWTIDFWIYTTETTTQNKTVCGHYENNQDNWALNYIANYGRIQMSMEFGNVPAGWGGPPDGSIPKNTWTHIAIVKKGGSGSYNVAFYVNGVQKSYETSSVVGTVDGSVLLNIGRTGWGGQYMQGQMDDFRIYKGNAFSASPNSSLTDTIAVPTVAHTPDANTKLLIHGDGSIIDDRSVAFLQSGKFSAAAAFNGTDEYLTIPDSDDWKIFENMTDDRTMDFWIKYETPLAPGEQDDVLFRHGPDGDYWQLNMKHHATNPSFCGWHLGSWSNGGSVVAFNTGYAGLITDTNWHHVAIVKNAGNIGIYQDGVQISYSAISANCTSYGELQIGCNGNYEAYFFNGSLDDLRIQKSNIFNASPNASLTDTITVPTSPHVKDANTKLLLHFDNDFEDEAGAEVVAVSGTEYTESGLADGAYTYYVRSRDGVGLTSSYSTGITINVDDALMLDPPTLVEANPGTTKWYEDESVAYTVTATDGFGQLEYKFTVNGVTEQDYSASPSCTFTSLANNPGRKTIGMTVRDQIGRSDEESFDVFVYRRPVA